MTKRKRFCLITLILVGFALLPLIILNIWASLMLTHVRNQKTDQGITRWETTLQRAFPKPAGTNLLDLPLWKQYWSEKQAYDKKIEEIRLIPPTPQNDSGAASGYFAKELPPEPTNAISLWKQRSSEHYQIFFSDKNNNNATQPRPGSIASREQAPLPSLDEILETAHSKTRKEGSTNLVANYPDWAPYYSHFLQTVATSEEYQKGDTHQQIAALALGYMNDKDSPWEQMKEDFKRSTYLGIESHQSDSNPVENAKNVMALSVLKKNIAFEGVKMAEWYAKIGRRAEAMSELEGMLYFVTLDSCYSTIMDSLINIANQSLVISGIHNIMLDDILNEEDLLFIQTKLGQINVMETLQQGIEGEQIYTDSIHSPIILFNTSNWNALFLCLSGIAKLNRPDYIQAFFDFADCIDTQEQTLDTQSLNKLINTKIGLSNFLFNKPLYETVEKLFLKGMQMQSTRDVAIIACALERYRLKNGKYPEGLQELIPHFMETMPPGLEKQGTLTYQLEGEKGYKLISNKLPDYEFRADFRGNKDMNIIWRR